MRHSAKITAAACCALFWVNCCRGADQPNEDWPQFLGPHRDGTSDETGLLDRWPTNGVPVIWEKKIGTGYSAPSVRGDRLALHHRVGEEEIVECFDAGTGKPLWRYGYPSQFIDPYGYNNGGTCRPRFSALAVRRSWKGTC